MSINPKYLQIDEANPASISNRETEMFEPLGLQRFELQFTPQDSRSRRYPAENVYIVPEIAGKLAGVGQVTVYANLGLPSFYMDAVTFSSYRHEVEAKARAFNRALADGLCEFHPAISTYAGIFGGNPHVKDLRFSV